MKTARNIYLLGDNTFVVLDDAERKLWEFKSYIAKDRFKSVTEFGKVYNRLQNTSGYPNAMYADGLYSKNSGYVWKYGNDRYKEYVKEHRDCGDPLAWASIKYDEIKESISHCGPIRSSGEIVRPAGSTELVFTDDIKSVRNNMDAIDSDEIFNGIVKEYAEQLSSVSQQPVIYVSEALLMNGFKIVGDAEYGGYRQILPIDKADAIIKHYNTKAKKLNQEVQLRIETVYTDKDGMISGSDDGIMIGTGQNPVPFAEFLTNKLDNHHKKIAELNGMLKREELNGSGLEKIVQAVKMNGGNARQ